MRRFLSMDIAGIFYYAQLNMSDYKDNPILGRVNYTKLVGQSKCKYNAAVMRNLQVDAKEEVRGQDERRGFCQKNP